MKSVREFIKNWIGFTRRERRSAFILLAVILVITGSRALIPDSSTKPEEIALNFKESDERYLSVSEPKPAEERQQKRTTVRRKMPVIELNSCDSADLVALPGIGPVLSVRIIKYRRLLGGYVSVNQLKEVYGLPPETFDLISSGLTADTLSVRRIGVNEAEFSELIRHPYFTRNEVNAILKFRELEGRISGVNEMVKNNLISAETAAKIKKYLSF